MRAMSSCPTARPTPVFRFNDAEKLEGLRGFAHAEATDAKANRELALGGQAIAQAESLGGNVLFDAFRHFIANLATRDSLELHDDIFPVGTRAADACNGNPWRIDYLTI